MGCEQYNLPVYANACSRAYNHVVAIPEERPKSCSCALHRPGWGVDLIPHRRCRDCCCCNGRHGLVPTALMKLPLSFLQESSRLQQQRGITGPCCLPHPQARVAEAAATAEAAAAVASDTLLSGSCCCRKSQPKHHRNSCYRKATFHLSRAQGMCHVSKRRSTFPCGPPTCRTALRCTRSSRQRRAEGQTGRCRGGMRRATAPTMHQTHPG